MNTWVKNFQSPKNNLSKINKKHLFIIPKSEWMNNHQSIPRRKKPPIFSLIFYQILTDHKDVKQEYFQQENQIHMIKLDIVLQ